jgi:hypothetical protein
MARVEMQEIGAPGENLCMVFGRPPEAFFSHGLTDWLFIRKQ